MNKNINWKNIKVFTDQSYTGSIPKENDKQTLAHLLNDYIAWPISNEIVVELINFRQQLYKFSDSEIIETLRDKFPERFI